MRWPEITEPLLLERMAMTDAEFGDFTARMAGALPPREYLPEHYERAVGYPWDRPKSSFLLTENTVDPVADMDDGGRHDVMTRFAWSGERHPLLAYGSNGSPSTLAAKFAHLSSEADRSVLVLAGTLTDFDVGAAAHPTAYGAMPATLFPSAGTSVRCAVLWVTQAQFVQLSWTEISYRLGRLEGIRFDPDESGVDLDAVHLFVSRFGAFAPLGTPLAMAAVPARARTATAASQTELLGHAARITLGEGSTAKDLVRELFSDLPAFLDERSPSLRTAAVPFADDRWKPYPA